MLRRLGLPLLVCLASLTPRAGLAEILWKGDFETGDLSQWSGKLNLMTNQRTNIKVIDAPRVGGLHAGELVIHPDDLWPNAHNRVELHQDVQTTDEGETTFLSWFFQLPAHAKQHNDIGYWESNGSYQQSMAFFVEPANGGTELSFRTNRPNGTVHWTAPLTVGVWHQLAMQILWSTNANTGRVSVWLDSSKVVNEVAVQTKMDANKLFIQVGYHRNATKPDVESILVDDAVEATTLEEILAPPPGAGGTGGAGGATGGGANSAGSAGSLSGGGAAGAVGSAASAGVTSSGGAAGFVGVDPLPMAGAGTPSSSPSAASTDDAGCGCRAASGSPSRSHGYAWLVAGALAARRRRRVQAQ